MSEMQDALERYLVTTYKLGGSDTQTASVVIDVPYFRNIEFGIPIDVPPEGPLFKLLLSSIEDWLRSKPVLYSRKGTTTIIKGTDTEYKQAAYLISKKLIDTGPNPKRLLSRVMTQAVSETVAKASEVSDPSGYAEYCARRTVELLREAIEKNDAVYTGTLLNSIYVTTDTETTDPGKILDLNEFLKMLDRLTE